jgi:hypothetical protein
VFDSEQAQTIRAAAGDCDVEKLAQIIVAGGFDGYEYVGLWPDLHDLPPSDALLHLLSDGFRRKRFPPPDPHPLVRRRELGDSLAALGELPGLRASYLRHLAFHLFACQVRDWRENSQKLLAGYDLGALCRKLRAGGGIPHVVIGDSHAHLMVRAAFFEKFWLAPLPILCMGASAMGLGSERSRSNYGPQLLHWSATLPTIGFDAPVLLKFGQVDAEFVWILRRIRDGIRDFSVDQFRDFAVQSTGRYFAFIDALKVHLAPPLIRVCSLFPPTLSDEAWAQGYVNAHIGFLEGDRELAELAAATRDLEVPDLAMRTQLHALYNAELERLCRERSVAYVDCFTPFLGGDGLVEPSMFSHGGTDHHLGHQETSSLTGDIIARSLV